MSTHSLTVSGPSSTLAMLRLLLQRAAARTGHLLTGLRITLGTGSRLVTTAATSALALIGSDTGYELLRHGVRSALTATAGFLRRGLRLLGSGLTTAVRFADRVMTAVAPRAAYVVRDATLTWITGPVKAGVQAAGRWFSAAGETLWHITGTSLVRTITVTAAQIAGVALGVHTITRGAVAARLVMVVPASMTAVAWLTQPLHALAVVAGAFLLAIAAAATVSLNSGSMASRPSQPARDSLADPATRDLPADPSRLSTQALREFERIAAALNVEILPDGSVMVHGIPDDLPDRVALEAAHIAADAATARLHRIRLHRPVPNRDDRRLLTKVAREAVRQSGRRQARASV